MADPRIRRGRGCPYKAQTTLEIDRMKPRYPIEPDRLDMHLSNPSDAIHSFSLPFNTSLSNDMYGLILATSNLTAPSTVKVILTRYIPINYSPVDR